MPKHSRHRAIRHGLSAFPWLDRIIEHAFSKGSMETGFAFGGAVSFRIFGSSAFHDFVLGSVHFGRIMSDTKCADTWYEGNWELLAEVFGGYQLNNDGASLVGLTPFIRYNFIAHSRWIPFVEAGGGVSYTDISGPDLSTSFEFNLRPAWESGTSYARIWPPLYRQDICMSPMPT